MLQHSAPAPVKKKLRISINWRMNICASPTRACVQKDNAFNTEIITSFDETIGNINVVPQDIGRVLLNLYNNAFYAVNERQKG